MASGSPRAAYAVLSRTASGWDAEFLEVDYDWRAAADLARRNGRGDWAQWLSTGRA
jgi:hypothetical protein